MESAKWQNSNVWKRMDPRKKMVINNLVEQSKGKSLEQAAGIIMASVNQMNKQKLSFSNEEKNLMMEVLTADMSDEEKAKVEMIKKFTK